MRTTFLLVIFTVSALTLRAQKAQTLKHVLELKMPKTKDDDMPGTRGASVAWHPVQKKYYAVFAGNEDFPLGVFDEKGKRLSPDDQRAMVDTRGLWYNPSTKMITTNGYDDIGWFTYVLDAKGLPLDLEIVIDGMRQPDAQSVGTYHPASNSVLFLHNSTVYMYDDFGDKQDSLSINWGTKKQDGAQGGAYDDEISEDYNFTTVIYTGVKGQELGFLNTVKKQIELYDILNGFLAKIVSLPPSASTENTFNFAYANGIYWLFDMANRKWVGYK